jgi:hypothetical protein
MRTMYRLRTETSAIVTRYGNRDLITIRSGKIIAVEEPLERDVVRVDWDGETVWMFTRDIQERGELVLESSAATC